MHAISVGNDGDQLKTQLAEPELEMQTNWEEVESQETIVNLQKALESSSYEHHAGAGTYMAVGDWCFLTVED